MSCISKLRRYFLRCTCIASPCVRQSESPVFRVWSDLCISGSCQPPTGELNRVSSPRGSLSCVRCYCNGCTFRFERFDLLRFQGWQGRNLNSYAYTKRERFNLPGSIASKNVSDFVRQNHRFAKLQRIRTMLAMNVLAILQTSGTEHICG